MRDIKLKAHQLELEKLYNKNQLVPRIRGMFIDGGAIQHLENLGVDVKFGLDLLVQMSLHKRCTLPTLVGVLDKHLNNVQATADLLLECAHKDLVNWEHDNFVLQYHITPEVQEELDKYQFPLPMVVPPKVLKNNMDLGYYTSNGSVILKKNHHDDDICLDHLNRQNNIPFKINHRVVKMVKHQWRNLDKPKEGETRQDFEKRKKAFEKYDRSCHEVIAKVTEITDVFYLTHRPDKRGRTYCQGYHVNYMGAEWNKATVEFANAELVT